MCRKTAFDARTAPTVPAQASIFGFSMLRGRPTVQDNCCAKSARNGNYPPEANNSEPTPQVGKRATELAFVFPTAAGRATYLPSLSFNERTARFTGSGWSPAVPTQFVAHLLKPTAAINAAPSRHPPPFRTSFTTSGQGTQGTSECKISCFNAANNQTNFRGRHAYRVSPHQKS